MNRKKMTLFNYVNGVFLLLLVIVCILPILQNHSSRILINVIVHLRKHLEITSLALYGAININREHMDEHAVESADKQNRNQHQPDFSFSCMTLYRILTGSRCLKQGE